MVALILSARELDDNTKRFLTSQLFWIGIYFGIALAATMLLDFPWSLLVVLGAVIPLALYRRRRQLKTMGQRGSFFGGEGSGNMFGSGVSYYCMNCGMKHNQASCPSCGSKLKKAGF
jgi:hypothetical protein